MMVRSAILCAIVACASAFSVAPSYCPALRPSHPLPSISVPQDSESLRIPVTADGGVQRLPGGSLQAGPCVQDQVLMCV